MPDFTLENGKRYRATLSLGLLEKLASNDRVAEELRDAGFSDVSVTGSGKIRIATGVWSRDTVTGPVPGRIKEVVMIA